MKRNAIISMEKLPNELLHTFRETYPYGYSDHVQKVVKPSGEVMYVVRFETNEVTYAVKVNPFRNIKKDDDLSPDLADNYSGDDDDMDSSDIDVDYDVDELE